jgi:hypothetical protein
LRRISVNIGIAMRKVMYKYLISGIACLPHHAVACTQDAGAGTVLELSRPPLPSHALAGLLAHGQEQCFRATTSSLHKTKFCTRLGLFLPLAEGCVARTARCRSWSGQAIQPSFPTRTCRAARVWFRAKRRNLISGVIWEERGVALSLLCFGHCVHRNESS